MKFLADMGIALAVVKTLRDWGYDALHVRECMPITSDDETILNRASSEGRVVLTMDHDFGDLLFLLGSTMPSLIFFRVNDEKPESIIQKLRAVLNTASESIVSGAIVTVEDTRFRIRALPIRAIPPKPE